MLAPLTLVRPAGILHLVRGRAPVRLDHVEEIPAEGFLWLDFVRPEAEGWKTWPQRLLGVEPDRRHVADSLENNHKSFFDVTPQYDLLIFAGLGPRDDAFPIETRSASFFV